MKKILFKADAKSGRVEAAGIEMEARTGDLKIFINGSDLSDLFKLEIIEIVIEKE